MTIRWAPLALFAGALILGPAAATAQQEQVSAMLLKEAKEKVTRIERLISAANAGEPMAQFDLGMMIDREGRRYVNRQIEKMSTEEVKKTNFAGIRSRLGEVQEAAMEWYLRAAMQGHDLSQWTLSRKYEHTDLVRAYAWNRILYRKHGRDATSMRSGINKPMADRLLKKMTDDQVTEAIELSHQLEREIQRRSNSGNQ